MKSTRYTTLGLMLPLLAIGYLACGDDDGSTSTTTTMTTASGGASGSGGGGGGGAGPVETFANPPETVVDDLTPVVLDVAAAAVTIDGGDYCLRTFNGMLPAPTLRIPASTNPRQIRVDLNNTFQAADNQPVGMSTYNFNATNLHTHGFHVRADTTGDGLFQSDNVLIHLMPGQSESYRFDIDEDGTHEAGTFWYHPHVHGATAIQVGSGMAGAIIIEGPVDEIPGIADARERILLMQHIPYEMVPPLPDGVQCTENNLSVNTFATIAGPTNVLVNGLLEPEMHMAPSAVERWRFIHGGVSNEMTMTLQPAAGDSCDTVENTRLELHQIAADGITFAQKWTRQSMLLAPGYRADIMVEAPAEEGLYCLRATMPGGMPGQMVDVTVAAVRVTDAAGAASGAVPSDAELAAVAKPVIDCNGPVDGTQVSIFAQQFDANNMPCEGTGPGPGPALNINCKSFDPNDPRLLTLGNTEEWALSSEAAEHPFHIHINPFTVCSGIVDGEPLPFPHYRDTLLIREGDGVTSVRMAYEAFTGAFVSHCHKLQHEDGGMMELIEIVP